MKKSEIFSKRPLWSFIFLLSAFAVGCKGNGSDNSKDGTETTDSSGGSTDGENTTAVKVTIASTFPVDTSKEVPINSRITAIFAAAIDSKTLTTTTFTLTGPDATPISGAVTYGASSTTAVFTPASNLGASTAYTATVTTGIKNEAGTALASDLVWTFTTGENPDSTSPTANSTSPAANAIAAPINRQLSVIFDEAMDPTTITTATFTVSGPGATAVAGSVVYTGTTATFTPASDLAPNTLYTVTMTTGVTDLAGNALASELVWTFTTGATAAEGPGPVVLGTAGDYAVLAKAAISTTGVTAVVGDIGLSPAAQSFITGFSETLDATNEFATAGIVTGKLYAADMAGPTPSGLTTAVSNMETAYTDAAGRTLPDFTEKGAGDISGMTLVPGLYKWGTGVLMTTDVTLAGGANDVWIFQVAQDLTISNGVIVTLSGGALPKNIFWQVAGQVVLGTTADFKGIVLSQTQIVLQTGAVLNGRALAQTAVTLDANAVTQPAD